MWNNPPSGLSSKVDSLCLTDKDFRIWSWEFEIRFIRSFLMGWAAIEEFGWWTVWKENGWSLAVHQVVRTTSNWTWPYKEVGWNNRSQGMRGALWISWKLLLGNRHYLPLIQLAALLYWHWETDSKNSNKILHCMWQQYTDSNMGFPQEAWW